MKTKAAGHSDQAVRPLSASKPPIKHSKPSKRSEKGKQTSPKTKTVESTKAARKDGNVEIAARRDSANKPIHQHQAKPMTQMKPPRSRPACIPHAKTDLHFDAEKNPSRTKQSEAAACDINNIMKRYQRTGVVDHVSKWGSKYGDVPAIDFHEAMQIIRTGEEMFADLPSSVRDRFSDPAEFLAYVQDPDNSDALETLGLTDPVPLHQKPPNRPPAASEAPPEPNSAPTPTSSGTDES